MLIKIKDSVRGLDAYINPMLLEAITFWSPHTIITHYPCGKEWRADIEYLEVILKAIERQL